jgi:hypothetical protein
MIEPAPGRRCAEEMLGIADRHLAEAEERLRYVERTVLPRLGPRGRGRMLAEELLATMRCSLELMQAHRKVLGELTGVTQPDPAPHGP